MIHFLAFYVKRLKKAHFKEFYSTKRSTFQNFYAKRLKSKNFYSIKSALFRISMQMKRHFLYSWINLRGANLPPPYKNNLYKIAYVIIFSRYSLKIRGGSSTPPPNLSTASLGGGLMRPPPPPPNPPTLAPLAYENISIHSFIVFVYVFIHSFIQLFIYSFILNGISIYFCTDPLYMYMYITTPNRNDMCIKGIINHMLYYFGLTETIELRFSYRNMSIQWCK